MNRTAILSLAALLALGVPVHGQAVSADVFKRIQTKVQEKKYADAVAEAEQALGAAGLSANDKVRLAKAGAEASLRVGKAGVDGAIAFYERVVADPEIPSAAKVEAINGIANAQIASLGGLDLVQMDVANARATLNRALELTELKPEDRAAAIKNIGRLYDREGDYAQARKAYEQIVGLDVRDQTKNDARRLIADTLANQGDEDAAIEMYREHGLDIVSLYQRLGRTKDRYDECVAILNDPKAAEHVRWTAFNRLPCWDHTSKDLSEIRAACEKYLPAFLEKDASRVAVLQRRFVDRAIGVDHAFAEWATPLLLAAPKLSDADYAVVKTAYIDSLAVQGKVDAAVEAAGAVAADQRIAATGRLWATLVTVTLKPVGDASITAAVAEANGVSGQDKADAILRAAKTVLRAGNEQGARQLFGAYETMLNRPARAKITCAFVPNAPYDVGSWLTSPLLTAAEGKGKLDRPYGDNLEFLLATDSAVMGRNVSAKSGEVAGDQQTDFYTVCDAEGLHLFFNTLDSKADEVVSGLVGGGSYEMYLAPGDHQAYLTFLADLPGGDIDPGGFITMYPNPQFRLPSKTDGTLRTATQATGKGFATHLFLSWELFYDKLPTDGTAWQFDAIRWTRAGGLSFGGSESVHNRSSWGDVVFSGMTDEHLTAIKRGIIYKAVVKYRAERKPIGALGGWSDAVLGDPAFYQAKVEPMVKRLDEYAAMVKKDLSAAEVETLFKEAVPGWMEGPYIVAAMRSEYLRDAMLRAAK